MKVINFKRDSPRGRHALVRQIEYLFTPKKDGQRLLGPPEMTKLALVPPPHGEDIRLAADQLAEQMLRYCKAACQGRPIPEVWYVHIIVAFAPSARAALSKPASKPPTGRWGPLAGNACIISRDVLGSFGWTPSHPTLFVVHGDTQHVHVHVVSVIPVIGKQPDWDILRISRRKLFPAAKACAERYGIPYEPRAAIVPDEMNEGQAVTPAQTRGASASPARAGNGARASHATCGKPSAATGGADLPAHPAGAAGAFASASRTAGAERSSDPAPWRPC